MKRQSRKPSKFYRHLLPSWHLIARVICSNCRYDVGVAKLIEDEGQNVLRVQEVEQLGECGCREKG